MPQGEDTADQLKRAAECLRRLARAAEDQGLHRAASRFWEAAAAVRDCRSAVPHLESVRDSRLPLEGL